MGALFGKSKKHASRVTEQDKAVLQLKQQRDKLKQYQKRIELNLEKDRQLAKTLLTNGKRERAKLLLKKKHYQEQLLSNTDSQLENLEKLVHDIEFAQIEIQVLDGLKTGNAALKKVHEVLNIDEIEQILEETKEGVDKQHEIDAILSGTLTEEDEMAVEAELEEMLGIGEKLPDVPEELEEENAELELPEVPKPVREKKRERVALEA
ncbi:charged multivesicular body protein 6-B-like [Arctopsyche grandis]|uniref:charged multivesicular body protein 6-B-like n=1 Tax=Arctopsyche grandis TaxID=121162 RepID=UPI00406D7939